MRYSIQGETLEGIAEGTRLHTGTWDELTPTEMAEALQEDYGIHEDVEVDTTSDGWERPEGWPDLDALAESEGDHDYSLMTYDADREASCIAWHVETSDGNPATFEIGHAEGGAFVADETATVMHNTSYLKWTDDLSGLLVIRVTGSISRMYSVSATADGMTMNHHQQPILERVSYLPHLTAFATNVNSNGWATYTLVRDRLSNGENGALTTLTNSWSTSYNLVDVDISGLTFASPVSAVSAFSTCPSLSRVALPAMSVTTAESMFYGCRSIRRIDMTMVDTSRCTSLYRTFYSCVSLREIDGIGTLDTSSVTSFTDTFSECISLVLPTLEWDTSKATRVNGVFINCRSVQELDLSSWDVSSATMMQSMFGGCRSLRRIRFWETENRVTTSAYNMFEACYSLEAVDVSWLHLTSACTSASGMFSNCYRLERIDIPGDWDMSGITGSATGGITNMFKGCHSLREVTGIADWRFAKPLGTAGVFQDCISLTHVDVSGWDVSTSLSFGSTFRECHSLRSLDLSGWSVSSSCTTLDYMFAYCFSLTDIGDVSGWDTSGVTKTSSMFASCHSLRTPTGIGEWDMSKVTEAGSMFSTALSMETLELGWDMASVTSVNSMLQNMFMLKRADLSGMSMPKATTATNMMSYCYELKELYPPQIFCNHSYAYDYSLSHESLIRILEALPTVTAARTVNLTSANVARLTAAEKKIATDKGWTIAN